MPRSSSDPRTPFAELLIKLRTSRKLSQAGLAELTDGRVSDGFIGRLELGNRSPSADTIDALAIAMQVTGAEWAALYEAAGKTDEWAGRNADYRALIDGAVSIVNEILDTSRPDKKGGDDRRARDPAFQKTIDRLSDDDWQRIKDMAERLLGEAT